MGVLNVQRCKAFYEFITENKVEYEWIGMNGYYHENVGVIINSIK